MKQTKFAFHKILPATHYDQAVQRTTDALRSEGLGVLTSIDVKETLSEKLSVQFKRYIILGACNPNLAYQALSVEDTVGLLLPCNVVVAEAGDGSEVGILRPAAMFSFLEQSDLRPVVDEAEQRLKRVLERL